MEEIRDRKGNCYPNKVYCSQRFLYRTFLGRFILKILIQPSFSKRIGTYLDSEKSKKKIPSFIKKNHIQTDEYLLDDIHSFNDFFSRKIKPGKREIDQEQNHFISPCDGKVTVYKITDDLKVEIKNSIYTIKELIQNENLVSKFKDGTMIVLRLSVDDYHRYIYLDDGEQEKNIFIPGLLHTVNPIAFERYKVYSENQREYTILHTLHFADVIQMEVGALLVGKIDNYHENNTFFRGEEKGRFLYGGSTIVLFTNKNVKIDPDILKNSSEGVETIVKMGERIGSYCE